LIAVKGYTSPEMEETVARALQLCRDIGETPMLFPVLYGRWALLYAAGRAQEGYEKAQEFLRLAEGQRSEALRAVGHRLVCHSSSTVGHFRTAREHVERLLELYDAKRDRPLALLYGTDPRITTLGIAAVVEWALGRPDTALDAARRGLEEARSHPHLNTRGYALIWCGVLPNLLCRDAAAAERGAQEAIDFAREREFPLWVAWGTAFLGCAQVQQGHRVEGIDALHRGLDGLAEQHFGLLRSATLTWLAEAYGAAGKPEQGLGHVAEALRLLETGGDRFLEAESHRVRGVLLAQTAADRHAARASLLRALEVARYQGALTLELRAATRLARLDREAGRGKQGRALLEPLVRAFQEGHGRPDLCDAREELARLTTP
jgi:predicted ATPase